MALPETTWHHQQPCQGGIGAILEKLKKAYIIDYKWSCYKSTVY